MILKKNLEQLNMVIYIKIKNMNRLILVGMIIFIYCGLKWSKKEFYVFFVVKSKDANKVRMKNKEKTNKQENNFLRKFI